MMVQFVGRDVHEKFTVGADAGQGVVVLGVPGHDAITLTALAAENLACRLEVAAGRARLPMGVEPLRVLHPLRAALLEAGE